MVRIIKLFLMALSLTLIGCSGYDHPDLRAPSEMMGMGCKPTNLWARRDISAWHRIYKCPSDLETLQDAAQEGEGEVLK